MAQEWECTIRLPDDTSRVVVVAVDRPLAQASAEVSALKQLGYDRAKATNPRCTHSRFLREVAS